MSEEMERNRVRTNGSNSAWEPGFVSALTSIQLLLCRCRIQFGLREIKRQ